MNGWVFCENVGSRKRRILMDKMGGRVSSRKHGGDEQYKGTKMAMQNSRRRIIE